MLLFLSIFNTPDTILLYYPILFPIMFTLHSMVAARDARDCLRAKRLPLVPTYRCRHVTWPHFGVISVLYANLPRWRTVHLVP